MSEREEKVYVLAELGILPRVFEGVLTAKRMLASGEVKSATEAARRCGISRGTFYKYKDKLFEYRGKVGAHTATVRCVLEDSAGTLSGLISKLSGVGANILTVSQGLPAGGMAPVTVSFRCPPGDFSLNRLLAELRLLRGVQSADLIETG